MEDMDVDEAEDASPCLAQSWFMIELDGVPGGECIRERAGRVLCMVCTVTPHQLYKFVMDCMIKVYPRGCFCLLACLLACVGRDYCLLVGSFEAERAVSNRDGSEVSRSDESGLPAVW